MSQSHLHINGGTSVMVSPYIYRPGTILVAQCCTASIKFRFFLAESTKQHSHIPDAAEP